MSETQRQKQKALTRKKLIDTALNLFAQKGLTTTRTADVAKAAGVSHGTIFVHFPTQEELLSSVIEEFGTRIAARLHELADKRCSLEDVLKSHLSGLMEFEEFYTRLVIERRLLPECARDTYIMIQSIISHHINIAAEMEIQNGVIRDIPVHLLYNTWIGIVHYYISNSDLFAPEESVLKRYGEELIAHYISLIKA